MRIALEQTLRCSSIVEKLPSHGHLLSSQTMGQTSCSSPMTRYTILLSCLIVARTLMGSLQQGHGFLLLVQGLAQPTQKSLPQLLCSNAVLGLGTLLQTPHRKSSALLGTFKQATGTLSRFSIRLAQYADLSPFSLCPCTLFTRIHVALRAS